MSEQDSYVPQGETAAIRRKSRTYHLQLVNWMDYRGWEVRQSVLDGVTPKTLGYIHQHDRDLGDTRWAARPVGEVEVRDWFTRDGALTHLLIVAGVSN